MVDQIAEDLAPFTHQLSQKSLDKIYSKKKPSLIRLRIHGGELSVQKNEIAQQHFIPPKIIPHFRDLLGLAALPDLDLILTSEDKIHFSGPVFCITKITNENKETILMPDWFALTGFQPLLHLLVQGNRLFPWESKQNTIFYRGRDGGADELEGWFTQPRTQLIGLSLQHPDLIDARFTQLYSTHWQVARALGYLAPYVSMRDHPRYKYLINVDSWCAATPRVPLILHSNSVLFQNTNNSMLWFFRAIKPYEHYIPIARDLSDLFTQLEWAKSHDDECKKISRNGRRFASKALTQEAAYLYLYRLLEAYAEKQKLYYHE
jgi:hypothetical protein